MRWTYYIEGNQGFPMNTRSYEIKNNLTDDVIHAYRRVLPEILVLVGDDYEYIKTLERESRFEKFTVEVHDSGTIHCSGEFTINDCSFDGYKSNCTIKLTPRDIYTQIQENEDVEVNIIADRKEITIERYSRWYFFITQTTGMQGQDDLVTGTKIVSSVNVSLFGIYVNLHVTELLEVDKDYGVPTGFKPTPFSDLGDTIIYQRYPVDFVLNYVVDGLGTVDLSDYQWSPQLLYHKPFDESLYNLINLSFGIAGSDIDYATLWIKKSAYNFRANYIFSQTYSGMELRSSLTRILNVACPDFTGAVKSGVLFNDIAESSKTFPVSYPFQTPDYGKYLVEMSDFRKPNASEQATKGITTWKQIIEYLCGKHDARWFIDSNGDLRIEHISYFDTNDVTLDISMTDVTMKYSYLSNDKPNREYLSESSGWNEDFDKIEVLYGTVPALNGTKENTKSISLSTFYTDIDGLNNHLSEISDSGFVYVDAALSSTPGGSGHVEGSVLKGTGFKSGELLLQNVELSNANCLNTYYRFNAYQTNYKIGGIDVVAITLKKQKTQDIIFVSDSIPDITKNIITRIGVGRVLSLSYRPTEEYNFKATLVYD
jgi:hypothetical protein